MFFQTCLPSAGQKDDGVNGNHSAHIWCAFSSPVFGHALDLYLSSAGDMGALLGYLAMERALENN